MKYEAAVMPPGSSIIFNSSIVAEVGFAGAAVYAASKGGVNALAFSAALELAKAGIRVNVLSPGVTLTDMARRGLGDDQSIQNLATNIIPLGRAAQPDRNSPGSAVPGLGSIFLHHRPGAKSRRRLYRTVIRPEPK